MINHQTRWDSHVPEMDIESHAEKLLQDIERYNKVRFPMYLSILTSHLYRPQGQRPIFFIAHSFGGLLLKQVRWSLDSILVFDMC